MALATRNKIRRLFSGRFTEKGEFLKDEIAIPARYHCECNPNGFVAGQAINHRTFCPFHQRNLDVFLAQEGTAVLVVVALLVFALCGVAAFGVISSVLSLL